MCISLNNSDIHSIMGDVSLLSNTPELLHSFCKSHLRTYNGQGTDQGDRDMG